ncbi:MAG: amidohydrolase family protein [Candidatus Eremiobacteraeota bacterium]|nr:amidohydrolase family protein [Candidatus Eremiobacteraeota bacterium]
MLTHEWLALLEQHGAPLYTVREVPGGLRAIHLNGAAFMTPVPEMFDYEMRIRDMDKAKVDVAIVSLSCPNVYWGAPEISLKAAQIMNDSMAQAQDRYPERVRFLASLPWQHPELALRELARARERGAVGVMVLSNIAGRALTDALFAPIWQAIDDAALPVLVHPTPPLSAAELGMHVFQLTASIGFTLDTSLAVARMILDGFFDRFSRLKLIAAHGGGTLPFLAGRLDICWDNIPATRSKTRHRPSWYLRGIYVDTVVFRQDALQMCIDVCGTENVLYGSDYPHTIGDMVGTLARVDALTGDVRAAVRSGNALRIFDLSERYVPKSCV